MDSSSRVRPGPWNRKPLRRYAAPERLRACILESLSPAPRVTLRERMRTLFARASAPWMGAGFGFAAGALAGAVALALHLDLPASDPVAEEVVANHVRSLMVDHLSDVDSTDGETVKSWFRGRLDYSPRVADMSSAGYSLVGGRLDYVAGRPVAAVIYSHARHVVNVFMCPLQGVGARAQGVAQRGFHALSWSDSGMQYWVVADLDVDELQRFAGSLRAAQAD